MAFIGEEQDVMRPEKGDSFITLPITFDYSGGRQEINKKKYFYAILLQLGATALGIYFFIDADFVFLVRLLVSAIIIWGSLLIVRFLFLNESLIKSQYEEIDRSDLAADYMKVWGIFEIDDEYPYFVRYRNGSTGVFIGLNKDVVLGKYSDSEYEHYEAIGDAYNVAGANDISMCHIDYMDRVGSDERINQSFAGLSEVDNTDVKDILMDIYGYLQLRMNEKVTTQDVYLFTFRGNEVNAWNAIQRVISCFMDANFVSYHVLDNNDIRNLFKTVFNVHDFSANKAMLSVFANQEGASGITPIKLVKGNGDVEVFNLTSKEKKEKARLEEEEKRLRSEAKKSKKKRKKSDSDIIGLDDEIDIF